MKDVKPIMLVTDENSANWHSDFQARSITSLRWHVLMGTDDVYSSKEQNTCACQNGVGFDHGNGFWSSAFAIGGQERLSRSNGYLSELAVAAYVCRKLCQRNLMLAWIIFSVLPQIHRHQKS